MLAASLPPQHTWYNPQHRRKPRGRDRNVSKVALARQASQERIREDKALQDEIDRRGKRRIERQKAELSCSPPNSSPLARPPTTTTLRVPPPPPVHEPPEPSSSRSPRTPTPPRSLPDQIQDAYANDDLLTAKTLHLLLKHNIHISSPTDPRLDTVCIEDFDEYFVPCGGLKLEPADARMVEEGKRRQAQMWEEEKRLERLRVCERIWEKEKRRQREEKLKSVRKREQEARAAEAARFQQEEQAQAQYWKRRSPMFRNRAPEPWLESGPSTSRYVSEDRPFEYAFMPPITPTRLSPRKKITSLPSSPSSSYISCSVSFQDVVNSMNGPLFPPDHTEQQQRRGASTSESSRTPAQSELLKSLLKVAEWDGDERRRARCKNTERAPRPTSSANNGTKARCIACSAATAPTSNASASISSRGTAISRTNSWLSFGSRVSSTASISTVATTPATSPISSWLKSAPPAVTASKNEKILAGIVKKQTLKHSCSTKDNTLTFVPLSECPLTLSAPKVIPLATEIDEGSDGVLSFTPGDNKKVGILGSFVELARGFQSAYVKAAMFSVTVDPYGSESTSMSRSPSSSFSRSPPRGTRANPGVGKKTKTPLPAGYRVNRSDIGVFIAPTPDELVEAGDEADELIHYIPLLSPLHPQPTPTPSTPHRSTSALRPDVVLKFPPQPFVHPSPYRPRTPPPHLSLRMRPIPNPVQLRLQALQNVLVSRGMVWEGRGREGMLGCGRDKVLGVGVEGRGRSGLSFGEVRIGRNVY